MQIITSHNSLDFDGLAAMVAAGKLYPSATKVFCGTLSTNVRQFMSLYKDHVLTKFPKQINLQEVDHMVVVDTRSPQRLGSLKELCQRSGVDLHIYDHHPDASGDLVGSVNEVHEVGAVTTVLVEKIIENDIPISPFEATIFALGIYEDTGSLLFSSTTSRDAAVVAFLLGRGANLLVVANFIEEPFSEGQRLILQDLLQTSQYHRINSLDIVIATSYVEKFVPGLDLVTHRLTEIEPADAVFVTVMMEGKVNIVARSRSTSIPVNDILAPLGGRGHARAASAVVRDRSLEEVTATIVANLEQIDGPILTAEKIMSSPVKTLSIDTSIGEAGRIMLRYGHTGMPVVDGDKIVGIISRRDVDKAHIHNLAHAPVKGFISRNVIFVTPDTPVSELQRLMVEKDVGRLPVISNGSLVGIVSRTDILRTLHGDGTQPGIHEVLYESDGGAWYDNCYELLIRRLPVRIVSILEMAGKIAADMGYTVYMVGGVVRDIFLQVPNFDVDLVVEGDGPALAHNLARALGGRARVHDRFKTAVVVLPEGFKLDIATARTEYYEFPAALPRVEKSSIREDLYRRDFTINTMAICLNPDRFGELIDYFGGRKDLQAGLIRVLYNLSFIEDPTRILRAIRFEQRYRFQIEPETLRFAREAIARRLLGRLSYNRIQQELGLILEEKDPVPALRRMDEIGVWHYVLPEVKLDNEVWIMLRRIPHILGWLAERWLEPSPRSAVVYILAILSPLTEEQIEQVLNRYQFDREVARTIRMAREVPYLAEEIEANPGLAMSELDHKVRRLSIENIVYLLLCFTSTEPWEKVVQYLELREDVRIQVSGYDLKRLGIKQGPVYQQILDELYGACLDGLVNDYEDELNLVRTWIAEGRFGLGKSGV
ncbi:MAG: CBS domain-containing protein [Syntrophomonadaceae bacterium]|jgi:tRNA nucleotidyltransferase (CCA-adding enzyme)|nr:CBS domain-containing protein [Syntrophomonadaceae bacterium]